MKTSYRRILAFVLPFLVVAFAPVPSIPKKLDLVGMIQHIHTNNDDLNKVNSKIVGNLSGISQAAGTSAQIDSLLHSSKDGLASENQSLARLHVDSQQEIDLSKSLNQLAYKLSNNLNTVHQYSVVQNQSIINLLATANKLSKLATQIEQTNGTIASKLTTATEESKQIANNMP